MMIGSIKTLAVLIGCVATVGCSIFKKIGEDLANAKAVIESEIGGEGDEAQMKQRVIELARKHFRYEFLGLDLSKGYVQRVDVSLYPSSNFRRKTTLRLRMNSAPVGT
jgi:hypothetical protein